MKFTIQIFNIYTKKRTKYTQDVKRQQNTYDSLIEALKLTKEQLGLEGQGWANCVSLSAIDEDGQVYYSFPSFHTLKDMFIDGDKQKLVLQEESNSKIESLEVDLDKISIGDAKYLSTSELSLEEIQNSHKEE